jgi:hypothetical protein
MIQDLQHELGRQKSMSDHRFREIPYFLSSRFFFNRNSDRHEPKAARLESVLAPYNKANVLNVADGLCPRIVLLAMVAIFVTSFLSGCAGGWGSQKPNVTSTQGTSQTVVSGKSVTFTATATGNGPFTYQWYLNGVAISGATSNSYTITTTSSSMNGYVYTAVVTNPGGSTSLDYTLTVETPPSIVTAPSSQTVIVGQSATFSTTATGTSPFSYQWYEDDVLISGATSSTYTTPVTTELGSHTFHVVVTNAAGSVTSSDATLTVNPIVPTLSFAAIATQTYGVSPFVVSASSTSSGAISYSVLSGPASISGSTLTITGAGTVELQASQVASGIYAAATTTTSFVVIDSTPVASSLSGSTTTPAYGATIELTPVFSNGTAVIGTSGLDSSDVTASAVSGQSYTTAAITAVKTYTLTVTSLSGTTATKTFTATPISKPVITTQPKSLSLCSGGSGTLSVTASDAVSYQWYLGSTAITGATSSSYNVSAAGSYYVVVTNAAGDVTSSTVTVAVGSSITTQPSNVSVYETQTATFSVSATGKSPFTYQWYIGTPGSGTAISGALSSTYTTSALTTTNSLEKYYATVSDSCSDSLTSSAATLTVTNTDTAVPPTIVVQPVGETATVGGTATFSVTASGSGTLSYQWYRVAYSATEVTTPTAGVIISGATSSSYTTGTVAQSNDGDTYYVIVKNTYGSAVSTRAVLAVGAGIMLQVTGQPVTQYVANNADASYSVTATCTGCTAAYQWYWAAPGSTTFTPLTDGAISSSSSTLYGATVSGATTATLSLTSIPSTASGSVLYVKVTSTDGTTQITGTNPISSNTAGLFVGSLGTVGNTDSEKGLCNSSGASWVLNGNNPGTTNSSNNVPYQNTSACTIKMTNSGTSESAAVYWPTLISTAKFSVSFTVEISAGSDPADGFTMVLADPSQGATTAKRGTTGEGLGAAGIPGLVLAFDTYQNGNITTTPSCTFVNTSPAYTVPCDPLTVPYMAIGQGALSLWENPWTNVNGYLNTQSSSNYTRAQFASTSHNYVVTVVNNIMTVTMDTYELFTGRVTLPPVAYLGFTASTGGSVETVVISDLTATVSAP